MEFAGKSVLITGSSRGIGYAAAMEFMSLGAHVAINGRTNESTRAAMEELGGENRLVAAPGDIGTVAGCEAAVGPVLAASMC
jgi:NAD(P)-dependent dehydrogenase (short-subunit alcohol dehydrogenase family)